MLSSIRERLHGLSVVPAAFLLAAGMLACAASTALRDGADVGVIVDVHVAEEGDATRVILVGLDEPRWSAVQQTNPLRVVVDLTAVKPGAEVGDLRVENGRVEQIQISPFATGGGQPMTRVEIALEQDEPFQVRPTDEGLEIRIGAEASAALDEPLADADDPWALGLGEEAAFEAPEPLDEAQSAEAPAAEPRDWSTGPESWEAPPATALLGVSAQQTGGGTLIHLQADGSVSNALTFTLEDPARLVVDLPQIESQVAIHEVAIDSPLAERVRIGVHDDMVRVVVDGGREAAAFDGRRVLPAPDGLLITLGAGEDLDRAAAEIAYASPGAGRAPAASEELSLRDALAAIEDAEASLLGTLEAEGEKAYDAPTGAEADPAEMADRPEPAAAAEPEMAAADFDEAWSLAEPEADAEATAPPAAEPAPAAPAADLAEARMPGSGSVSVYGVEYTPQAENDRIVVMADEPLDYWVSEPDPETLILILKDARIQPEARVRIAPEGGGPVSLVTAFDQPELRTPEVRVVVQRAANLKPQVTRKGSLLVVDFPRDGSARVPPIVAGAGADAPAVAAGHGDALPASLEPPAAIGILEEGGLRDGKQYTGRRISLDFKDVEIADVLRLIAEVSDLNVIAGDEVKGKVTIRLVDVPWDQALDVVLLTKGLGFVRIGSVLRIAPSDVLKQEEELRLQERRNLERLEDLVVKLQPVNYANVGDISSMVQRLLTERGTVNVDSRTNTVIIKDIPSVIDEATALIKAIDTQTPQVMIEAKIVEANLDFSREFGSVWSFGSQPLIDGFDPASGARRDLGGQDFRLNGDNNFQFGNPITAGPTGLWNLTAFILDEKINLDLQLQAAEVSGDGKVISSPRVVTLDNSKATIEQGVSIPFQTFENGDAQLEFVDAVLKLNVTPHITADRSIIMEIEVSRNAPDDSVFTLTGSPAIAKNQVETETLVKDGQTLVLGGIYVVDKSARQSRVPYLHKIPILGAAFRSDEISDSRKELLIFVSPRVVETVPTAS